MVAFEPLQTAIHVSPLTVLVRGVLEWTFPPGSLEELFQQYAPAQQTRRLTIDAMVGLLLQVVAGTRRSVFAAFQADEVSSTPTIPTSFQALYAKVGRTDPVFSAALVRYGGERLLPLLRQQGAIGSDWAGYQVRVWDGTDLDGSEHRLKVLRRLKSAGLPGRLVVEYDMASGLCLDAVASEDAYASEMVLVHRLVELAGAGRVYVADRNFCTWDILAGLADRHACFVIREHRKLRWQAGGKPRRVGRTETGEVWEQKLWVIDRHTGRRLAVRRIIIRLDQPTRHGETELRLLTNLPSRIKAPEIARLYRRRWMLEGHFNLVKNQLNGEIESLGRPRAALLMMALAMLAANALAVVKAALRGTMPTAIDDLSGYYLADEVAGNYRAVERLVPANCWYRLSESSPAEFWDWCGDVAKQIEPAAFRKHPRGPKKPPPRKTSGWKRPHYSTHRLLL